MQSDEKGRMMKRYALEQLKDWKNSKIRKPLLVQGARQVGKTWLLKEFGKECYENTAYVNFYDTPEAHNVFEGSYNVANIISALGSITNEQIVPGKTLIILDEIQECERALNALKFFKENAPQYHIAVAGSLLGVALNHNKMSFPVGQVDFMTLHPLSFCEFLEAVGKEVLAKNIQENNIDVLRMLHNDSVQLLKQYMVIGGMPEAVKTFIETRDYESAQKIHKDILVSYQNDFAKYTTGNNAAKIMAVWNSVPVQLAKQTRKTKRFFFSDVFPGARSRNLEDAIEWLRLSGLIHLVPKVSKPSLPLAGYVESGVFKVYMIDTGLLSTMSGLAAKTVIDGDRIFQEFKGALTEQYVLQELVLNDIRLNYWASESDSEIDFMFQYESDIVPVEAKANISLQAKSLHVYRQKYNPKFSVRTSLAGYEANNGLYNIPLYMIGNVLRIISE